MLRKIISAIIIAIADVLRGSTGHDHKRRGGGVKPWKIDNHQLPAPHTTNQKKGELL